MWQGKQEINVEIITVYKGLQKYKISIKNRMLRQSQLKKPLTVIVVLTGIAFLLEVGALGYQVISGFIGINKTQIIYTACSSSVNTILSNSNTFYIVALACAAIALITLALMFVLILMGMCKWNSSESKYVEPGSLNNGQNMATHANKANNQAGGDVEDQYFTSGKFLLGTIMYLVSLIGTLGHFSMMLTVAIGSTACSGSMMISLLVISVLGIIAFVLALVSFIKWQIQRRKLNPNNQQNPNQAGNQNQSLSQGNQNMSNQQTRQNLVNNKNQNLETIEPLRTQEDERRRPANNNKSKNNFLAPENTKNPEAEYMSFNGKNSPSQNDNLQSNQSSKDPKTKTAVSQNNQRESAQPRQASNKNQQEPTKSRNPPQQGSTNANPPKPKNNSQQQQSYSQAKPKNNNNQQLPSSQSKKASTDAKNNNNNINHAENPKPLKTSERMSLESSKGGSKHPTPKFILSQDEDNEEQSNQREASNILKQSNSKKDNQPKNSQKKQNQPNQPKLPKNKEPQKANDHYEDDNEQKIQNEEDFKESKKEIMKNNGGRPFFKSPPKPKETLPLYYRSPLEKYERQDQDNVRSRQKSQSNKNYPQSNPQSNPQSHSQESNLKSSISQKKLVEEQKKFLDQSNASSDKSRGQPQRQGKLNLHRNTGMELKNEQRRQTDQKSMKKSKKTGMLLDYIRSKYAD